MYGIKHIVECHCVLPQYRKRKNPLFHKFIVFSVVDEGDTVVAKHAQCNNCGVIHRVFDICKSEIVTGRDELGSLLSIDDIKFTIVPDVARVLESYSAELPNGNMHNLFCKMSNGENLLSSPEIKSMAKFKGKD